MESPLRPSRRIRPLLLLGFVVIVTLAGARSLIYPDHFDWPAWVQAVGSIAAILAAVWVSWDQVAQQRAREEAKEYAEAMGMIRSLRAEAETTLRYFSTEVARRFQEHNSSAPFVALFPLPDVLLPIFDALTPKLGGIPDSHLQREIIQTFALARGVLIKMRHHNEIATVYDTARYRWREHMNSVSSRVEEKRWLDELETYGRALRIDIEPVKEQLGTLYLDLLAACPEN